MRGLDFVQNRNITSPVIMGLDASTYSHLHCRLHNKIAKIVFVHAHDCDLKISRSVATCKSLNSCENLMGSRMEYTIVWKTRFCQLCCANGNANHCKDEFSTSIWQPQNHDHGLIAWLAAPDDHGTHVGHILLARP